MTTQEAVTYLNTTARIKYSNKTGPQSRTGFIMAVTTQKVILLIFEPDDIYTNGSGDHECELSINVSKIDSIKELKGVA